MAWPDGLFYVEVKDWGVSTSTSPVLRTSSFIYASAFAGLDEIKAERQRLKEARVGAAEKERRRNWWKGLLGLTLDR
jgi:hypothetical protein